METIKNLLKFIVAMICWLIFALILTGPVAYLFNHWTNLPDMLNKWLQMWK
jgi:hypothetical protein